MRTWYLVTKIFVLTKRKKLQVAAFLFVERKECTWVGMWWQRLHSWTADLALRYVCHDGTIGLFKGTQQHPLDLAPTDWPCKLTPAPAAPVG